MDFCFNAYSIIKLARKPDAELFSSIVYCAYKEKWKILTATTGAQRLTMVKAFLLSAKNHSQKLVKVINLIQEKEANNKYYKWFTLGIRSYKKAHNMRKQFWKCHANIAANTSANSKHCIVFS